MQSIRWLMCLALVLPNAGLAQLEWAADVFIENEYTDNARRTNEDEVEELTTSLGARVALSVAESRYTADALYSLERNYYENNVFSDNSTVVGSLALLGVVIPQRLDWIFNQTEEEVKTDSRLADTPDNREQRSVFSTGPRIYFNPTQIDTIQLSGTFRRTELEESDSNNSEVVSGLFSWGHELTELSEFNMTASVDEVSYTEIDDFEYTRESLSIGFSGERPQFLYSVSIGGNRISSDNEDDRTGANISLSISKEYSFSSFEFLVARSLTDTVNATGLEAEIVPDVGTEITDVNTISIVERTDALIAGDFSLIPDRLTLGVSLANSKVTSEDEGGADQNTTRFDAGLNYFLTRDAELFASLSYVDDEFLIEPTRNDNTYLLRVGSRYSFTNRLNCEVAIAHEQRDSDQESLDFESSSLLLSLSYLFGSRN